MKAEELMNDAVFNQKLRKKPELKKFYHQEKLIVEVTELISELMPRENINRTELAKRLGVGKSYVTQLLDGTSNMTLRTISDVFTVLDHELVISASPLSSGLGQSYVYEAEDETQFVGDVLPSEELNNVQPHWIPQEINKMVA